MEIDRNCIGSDSLVRYLLLVTVALSLTARPGTSYGQQQKGWHTSTGEEERPFFTEQFSPEEFAERRQKVYDRIGTSAIAVLQGAPAPEGFMHFRQYNEFFYLSGIETPHSYLLLDGQARKTILFLPQRRPSREYGEGKLLSAEDTNLVKKLSGIDDVYPNEQLIRELKKYDSNRDITTVYTPHSPYEGRTITRWMANRMLSDRQEDPLDNRPARVKHFIRELRGIMTLPKLQDLDPVLDELRKIKSKRELELIRKSTRLQGAAILESMRSTRPGVKPYELEAISKYIYWTHNVQGEAYYALIHVGPDAYKNHYHGSIRQARDGDMLLMDYGPDYHYYSSDMARMWPANGRFNEVQRELYTFYLKFYEAILFNIKEGLTPQQVKQHALAEIDRLLETTQFSKPVYEKAARAFVESFRESAQNPETRLGHGVGMAVHDVGDYAVPLQEGMVFVIEPQFRVPEENIYIRLEDMIAITEDGVEIISDFVPRDIESIEKIVSEEGGLEQYPVEID